MLKTLELANIRSYSNGVFQFSDSVNIVVGPNASGKTNLLEAVYMVATGSAFKSDDEQMISRNSDWARIDATYENQNVSIKIKRTPFSKKFVFDGIDKKNISNDKKIPIVLFEPSHMLLLGGEPERRRAYLDGLLSQVDLEFENSLKSYKRALMQRNKLLKQPSIDVDHLFVWDLRLSELAGKIVESRLKHIEFLKTYISEDYRSVSGNEEELNISYESKLLLDQYTSSMLKKLKNDFELDRRRGFTGSGPHRDDIKISIDGNDVRQNASRGETRSIVLALKISELRFVEQKNAKNQKPLLLLDDVFSELDGKRRRTLAQTLQKYQTFITTTDADVVIEHFSKSCNIIPTSSM